MKLLYTTCALVLLITIFAGTHAATTSGPDTTADSVTTAGSDTTAGGATGASATDAGSTGSTSGGVTNGASSSGTTQASATGASATGTVSSSSAASNTGSGNTATSGSVTNSDSATTAESVSTEAVTTSGPNMCYTCNSTSDASCISPNSSTAMCTNDACFTTINNTSGEISRACSYGSHSTCTSGQSGYAGDICWYCCNSGSLCNSNTPTTDACKTLIGSSANHLTTLPGSLLVILTIALQRIYS